MATKRVRIRKRVGLGTKVSKGRGNPAFTPGTSGNPGGRKAGPTFAGMLREILTRPRMYKNPKTGKPFQSSEMYLILRRAVKELRTGIEFDSTLFSMIMSRVDGKPRESLDVDGLKEIASELNAQDIILSRLAGIARARSTGGANPKDVSRRAIEDTIPVESMAKN